MAQYKVPDPDKMITCPYNNCERISAKRMPYHLMKCRKNYVGKDFATCPFNATHEMPRPELRYHTENCPDRVRIEPMLAHESSKIEQDGSLFSGCTNLPRYNNFVPNSDENWDDEIPTVSRIGVDPSYFAKLDRSAISGLKPAEKKFLQSQYSLPPEERTFVTQSNIKPEENEEEEYQDLRLPNTASQTYVARAKPPGHQSSAVFAYSLSMSGVGRGMPEYQSFGGSSLPGRGRSGYTGTEQFGRGITMQEKPTGRGINSKSRENNAPQLYGVGVGRGRGLLNA